MKREKALPIMLKKTKRRTSFISWAGRPYDLPQARREKFPRCLGAGKAECSFGGRGGKVNYSLLI